MATKTENPFQSREVPIHSKLAAAWTSFMFLYVYVDLLGLYPSGVPVRAGSLLHERFPAGLYPLRRDRTLAELRALTRAEPPERAPDPDPVTRPGHVAMAVGPVLTTMFWPSRLFSAVGSAMRICRRGLWRLAATSGVVSS